MIELLAGLIFGLVLGSLLTALAVRIAIDRLIVQPPDESPGYEDPYRDWPRRG